MQSYLVMQLILLYSVLLGAAVGFNMHPFKSRSKVSYTSIRPMSMSVEVRDIPGQLPPFGFFDPLNLAAGKTEKEIQKWRESELKHGRICMLAAVAIPLQELFHPLFQGRIEGPAIFHFQQIENLIPPFWYGALLIIGIFEGISISKGWESPDETRQSTTGVAMLKDGYVPGDLNFDPLGLRPEGGEVYGDYSQAFTSKRNKELSNGRLAMLAVAGMIAQEVVDGRTIIGHYLEFGFGRGTPY